MSANPKNGSEIMDQIEQMSFGWRPSPGSVYPLLEELAQEGMIRRREDGRYEITPRGRESASGPWDVFARHPVTVEGILQEMRANVAYLEDLRSAKPEQVLPHRRTMHDLGERLEKLGGRD